MRVVNRMNISFRPELIKTVPLPSCHFQAAPGIQRVIYFELGGQVFLIFGKTQAIAGGDRLQPASDRILVNIFGYIRGMNDLASRNKPGFLQTIF